MSPESQGRGDLGMWDLSKTRFAEQDVHAVLIDIGMGQNSIAPPWRWRKTSKGE
jgi:hypothetical protein